MTDKHPPAQEQRQKNQGLIDLLESWLNETPTQEEIEAERKSLAEIMVYLMRPSVVSETAQRNVESCSCGYPQTPCKRGQEHCTFVQDYAAPQGEHPSVLTSKGQADEVGKIDGAAPHVAPNEANQHNAPLGAHTLSRYEIESLRAVLTDCDSEELEIQINVICDMALDGLKARMAALSETRAHSKSEYRRVTAQGGEILPPVATPPNTADARDKLLLDMRAEIMRVGMGAPFDKPRFSRFVERITELRPERNGG